MRQAEGSRRARQPSQAISAISGGIYRKGNTAKSQIAKAANNPSASRPSEIFGISPQAIKSPPTLRLQVPSPQGRLGRTSRKTLCRRLIFLICTARHDLDLFIRQRPLQRLRLIPRRTHPDVALFIGGQDHRHGLGMDRLDHRVRCCRQEALDEMRTGYRL
jgi:hypothetical protein